MKIQLQDVLDGGKIVSGFGAFIMSMIFVGVYLVR